MMVPRAQEESGYQGTILCCFRSVASCMPCICGTPPGLVQEDLLVSGAQEESLIQGAVLFMFRSRVHDGAPPRRLQDDLLVPGAQEVSDLQSSFGSVASCMSCI